MEEQAFDLRNETAKRIAWGVALTGFGVSAVAQLWGGAPDKSGWMIFVISASLALTGYGISYCLALIALHPRASNGVPFSKPAPVPIHRPVTARGPIQTHEQPQPRSEALPIWMNHFMSQVVGDMVYVDANRLEKVQRVMMQELRQVAKARYKGELPEISERSLDAAGISRSTGRAKVVKDWLIENGFVKENGARQAYSWSSTADRLFLPPPFVVENGQPD